MIEKPKNCPQHCERRSATCHAECKDYLLYMEYRRKIDRMNREGRDLDYYAYAYDSRVRHERMKRNHKE